MNPACQQPPAGQQPPGACQQPRAGDGLHDGCQLATSFGEHREPRLWTVQRWARWGWFRARRPYWRLKTWLKRVLADGFRSGAGRPAQAAAGRSPAPPAAGVRPGDLVRVRPLAEIEATLDARGRTGGCAFLWSMRPFCGREFRVVRCVERFFDERTRRMLRCRNVVLLEGVYCDGQYAPPDARGCDRMCFFFWRTEWLERCTAAPAPE